MKSALDRTMLADHSRQKLPPGSVPRKIVKDAVAQQPPANSNTQPWRIALVGGAVSLIAQLVAACCRHAWSVLLLCLALAGLAFSYVSHHIAIDTDNAKLFPP